MREKKGDVVVVVVVVLGVYLTQVKVRSRLDWEKKTLGLGMVLKGGRLGGGSLSPPYVKYYSLSLSQFRTVGQLR